MKCPHVEKWVTHRCTEVDGSYYPTPFQLHEYCLSNGHPRCPIKLNAVLSAARNIALAAAGEA